MITNRFENFNQESKKTKSYLKEITSYGFDFPGFKKEGNITQMLKKIEEQNNELDADQLAEML